ncbi:MAG: NAD-dependent epimerase/dehydratase family protein, partial [Rikenellaceae bacterium]|nr:NAD-dependent epimerase/dehydratase family protein [Rikenellaceae bacterium]
MEQNEITGRLSRRLVCVTGATGMIGSELVRQLLDAGAQVRVVVRDGAKFNTLFPDGAVEAIEAPLNATPELLAAFRGMDVVYHCAAKVSFQQRGDEDLVGPNVEIAQTVVDACLGAGVGLLVHVSSIAALGPAQPGGMITETCYPETLVGWSAYGLSKYFSENEVWRGIKTGLRTVIVNPSIVLGPGDWRGSGSAALFAALAQGLPVYPPGVMGYVDVRDVAGAMIALSLTPEAVGKRFTLSGANLSYKELMAAAARSVGKPAPRWSVGVRTLYAVGFLEKIGSRLTGRTPKFTPGAARAACEKTYYDGSLVTRV